MSSIDVKRIGAAVGALCLGSALVGCATDTPKAAHGGDVAVQPWSFVTYQITGVANGGPGGGDPAIGNGAHLPVISYENANGLSALSWMPAASSWQAQTIVAAQVDHSAIATQGEDVAHIAYVQNGALYYASTTTRDGAWSAVQVDSPELYVVNGLPQPTGLQSPCLMVDGAGTPHIAYFVATGYSTAAVVELTLLASGLWDLEVVENLSGIDNGEFGNDPQPTPPLYQAGLSCVADATTGHRELAYSLQWTAMGAAVHHAWFNANGWATENFTQWQADLQAPAMSAGPGITPSIASISEDTNLVAQAGRDSVVTLATYGGAWSWAGPTPAGDVVPDQNVQIATEPDGSLLVLYTLNPPGGTSLNEPGSALHLSRQLAGSFVDYTIDPNLPLPWTSTALTVDPDGTPAIVYTKEDQMYWVTLAAQ